MTIVDFEGSKINLLENETVLEGLIRNGHDVPNGCRAGVCQSCMLQNEEGEVSPLAQKGLSRAQREMNYFLSCQCKPALPIQVKRVNTAGKQVDGTVVEKSWLNDDVIRLRIKAPLDYKPGQYITLWKDDAIARCYSLASHPKFHDYLEIHVKQYPDGVLSSWISESLFIGDKVGVQGPLGHCFYTADPDRPMLLSAIGTGLSPIYGILQDALSQGHRGPVDLVIGASSPKGFYMVEALQSLADKHENLKVHFVSQTKSAPFATKGDIYDYVKRLMPAMKNYRVYLCGAESFIKKMRKQCFMAGANMADISSDTFLSFNHGND